MNAPENRNPPPEYSRRRVILLALGAVVVASSLFAATRVYGKIKDSAENDRGSLSKEHREQTGESDGWKSEPGEAKHKKSEKKDRSALGRMDPDAKLEEDLERLKDDR